MAPKVFIIVIHFGSWKDTEECLRSFSHIDYLNYRVVLVDNDPGQISNLKSLATRIQKQISKIQIKKQKLKIISTQRNLGFAGGNNIGIRYALKHRADYILLLNNDTIVDKGFLKDLVKIGENGKSQIGILGPKIYFYDIKKKRKTKKVCFAGGKLNWLKTRGEHVSNSQSAVGNQQSAIPVDYITGCCLLIKREVIEKIGLLDEDYFLYYEDVDWNLKAQRAGYLSVLVPKAKIWHKVSQSAKPASFSYIYYHYRNALLLTKKNSSWLIRVIAYLASMINFKLQLIKLLIPAKREWAKAALKGIIDFYWGKKGKLYVNRHRCS